jgi:hypothetical protein
MRTQFAVEAARLLSPVASAPLLHGTSTGSAAMSMRSNFHRHLKVCKANITDATNSCYYVSHISLPGAHDKLDLPGSEGVSDIARLFHPCSLWAFGEDR